MAILSGPMFEPSESVHFVAQACPRCGTKRDGAHYNLFHIRGDVAALKDIFPSGRADEFNFCLFSTSGVHGSYTTIEQIEESLLQFPSGPPGPDDWPDDYHGTELTVLVVQPRICCLRYGNINVALDDIPYLKQLRRSSWDVVSKIGK